MELHLLAVFVSYLLVGVAVSHAALPSEMYWEHKLPTTPMPSMVHDILYPVDREGKPVTIPNRATPNGFYISCGQNTLPNKATPNGFYISCGQNTVSNNDPNRSNLHKVAGIKDTTNTQFPDIFVPGVSHLFLERDLYPGAKVNLQFALSTASGTTFLPQKLAKVTPFSSKKLPEILKLFSISPESEEAKVMKKTISSCEEPTMENEEKYCATSLESLVEYGTSKFGKNAKPLTTVISGDKVQKIRMKKQQYVVRSGVRQIASEYSVVCHSLPYLYAVFYCHAKTAHTTSTYVVPLVGADGTQVSAVGICHKDTSKWNPGHVAFQFLKVKPGGVPICHFLTEDNIVWVSKSN
ncbi:hypothetical protein MKW94_004751 [Papaver nudicaule]|uniref:BURP domain-containing protein n=1 Tax=Papaver nudicaule TaxID=74823 RepID=A0AA41S620_PAPNU|nr:hypothetical protein [Papaver nudicaule]